MPHIVTRSFEDEGIVRQQGEVVDASEWRNTAKLVDQRRLSVAAADLEAHICHCGRAWSSKKLAKAHCKKHSESPQPGQEGKNE